MNCRRVYRFALPRINDHYKAIGLAEDEVFIHEADAMSEDSDLPTVFHSTVPVEDFGDRRVTYVQREEWYRQSYQRGQCHHRVYYRSG